MAILRTISSALLPPVLASRRATQGTISSPVLNVENRRHSFPVLQISSQNSNILCMEAVADHKSAGDVHHVQVEGFPDDFAFKVTNTISSVYLAREYQGESIQVKASRCGPFRGCDGLYMDVNIAKGIQYDLLLKLRAYDDGLIKVDLFTMRGEALKAFGKFLEIRGIKPSVTNVLLDHIRKETEKLKKFPNVHQPLQGANNDISAEYYINWEGFPDGFPFKVIEVSGNGRLWPLDSDRRKRTLILSRKFQNDEILVKVAKAYQNDVENGVPMTVRDKKMSQFIKMTAYPDHIDIHIVKIRDTESAEYGKFLETRGINSSVINNILINYFKPRH